MLTLETRNCLWQREEAEAVAGQIAVRWRCEALLSKDEEVGAFDLLLILRRRILFAKPDQLKGEVSLKDNVVKCQADFESSHGKLPLHDGGGTLLGQLEREGGSGVAFTAADGTPWIAQCIKTSGIFISSDVVVTRREKEICKIGLGDSRKKIVIDWLDEQKPAKGEMCLTLFLSLSAFLLAGGSAEMNSA